MSLVLQIFQNLLNLKKNAKNNEQVMKNINCFLNKKSVNKMNYEQCVQLAHRIKTIWDIKNTKTFGGLYKALSVESKKLSSNIELLDKMKIIASISYELYKDSLSIKPKIKMNNYEEVLENIKFILNKEIVNKLNYEECVRLVHRIKETWDIKNKKTFISLSKFLSLESKKVSSNVELANKMMIMSIVSKKLHKNSFVIH